MNKAHTYAESRNDRTIAFVTHNLAGTLWKPANATRPGKTIVVAAREGVRLGSMLLGECTQI